MAEPEAASDPPGSEGEADMSVVVASIQPAFKLEDLGSAEKGSLKPIWPASVPTEKPSYCRLRAGITVNTDPQIARS